MHRLISLSFAWLLLGSCVFRVSAAPLRVLDGTFVRMEQGDYEHLIVRDAKGVEHSFFLTEDRSFQPLRAKPGKYRGKRLKVRWQHVKRSIPEAGGILPVDEAVSVTLGR